MAEDKTTKKRFSFKIGPAAKAGARIIAPVGAGALASVVGGSLARRVDAVAKFADTPTKTALVDAGAGGLLSAIGLMVFSKVTTPKKAVAYAPYVMAGAIGIPVMRALGPMVVDGVMGLVDKVMPAPALPAPAPVAAAPGGYRALPGGAYVDLNRGLAGMLPGGAYVDVGRGLGGALPAGWGDVGGPAFGPGNLQANRLPAGRPAGAFRF